MNRKDIVEIELHTLPHFEVKEIPPCISVDEYEFRIAKVKEIMEKRCLSNIIVYGDREYFSNIEFLTGYDPRFEEALLIIPLDDIPTLVVGNEGYAYSKISKVNMNRELYQNFSLQGQPRSRSSSLDKIFCKFGINNNSKVGIIGIKYLGKNETLEEIQFLDIPSYIIDCLRDITGKENIINVTDIMTHPTNGLRNVRLSCTEIALFEIAGTQVSLGAENFLNNLQIGMSEIEASKLLNLDGSPLPVYINVNFGRRNAQYGLASPSYTKKAKRGEVFSFTNTKRRALIARTGLLVSNRNEIKPEMDDIVEDFYKPYFEALVNWYETIGIGVSGAEVYENTMSILRNEKFGVSLNPGHQIHTNEWTNSPFFDSSPCILSSGMAIQCDIISAPGGKYFGVHVEDGIVLADDKLREEIRNLYPNTWERISKRREFIQNVIGIKIKKEVLPVSNIQAILHPYMLNGRIILSVRE